MKLAYLHEAVRGRQDPRFHMRRSMPGDDWHQKDGKHTRQSYDIKSHPLKGISKECSNCGIETETVPDGTKRFCRSCTTPERFEYLRKLNIHGLGGGKEWHCHNCNGDNPTL